MATPEIGELLGLILPVRSFQLLVPPAALVVTQRCPPGGLVPVPRPSVPAYITLEKPLESSAPPAASERTRLTSFPLHGGTPPGSKSLLIAVNAPAPPTPAPRHTRHVPISSSLALTCGSRIYGV